jgi:hypothetical protein
MNAKGPPQSPRPMVTSCPADVINVTVCCNADSVTLEGWGVLARLLPSFGSKRMCIQSQCLTLPACLPHPPVIPLESLKSQER